MIIMLQVGQQIKDSGQENGSVYIYLHVELELLVDYLIC